MIKIFFSGLLKPPPLIRIQLQPQNKEEIMLACGSYLQKFNILVSLNPDDYFLYYYSTDGKQEFDPITDNPKLASITDFKLKLIRFQNVLKIKLQLSELEPQEEQIKENLFINLMCEHDERMFNLQDLQLPIQSEQRLILDQLYNEEQNQYRQLMEFQMKLEELRQQYENQESQELKQQMLSLNLQIEKKKNMIDQIQDNCLGTMDKMLSKIEGQQSDIDRLQRLLQDAQIVENVNEIQQEQKPNVNLKKDTSQQSNVITKKIKIKNPIEFPIQPSVLQPNLQTYKKNLRQLPKIQIQKKNDMSEFIKDSYVSSTDNPEEEQQEPDENYIQHLLSMRQKIESLIERNEAKKNQQQQDQQIDNMKQDIIQLQKQVEQLDQNKEYGNQQQNQILNESKIFIRDVQNLEEVQKVQKVQKVEIVKNSLQIQQNQDNQISSKKYRLSQVKPQGFQKVEQNSSSNFFNRQNNRRLKPINLEKKQPEGD